MVPKRSKLMVALATGALAIGVLAALPSCKSDPAATDASAPTASTAALPADLAGVKLPVTKSRDALPKTGVRVVVSKTAVAVGSPAKQAVPLRSRTQVSQGGIAAEHKRSGPNDLFIVPLAKAIVTAKRSEEAILYVDAQTPYRLLVEVLFTLGQSEIGKDHFVARNKGRLVVSTFVPPSLKDLGELDVDVPPGLLDSAARASTASTAPSGAATGSAAPVPSVDPSATRLAPRGGGRLSLSVYVMGDGMAVKTRKGNVATGCKNIGSGVAVPKHGGAHDYASLTGCLVRLRALRKADDDESVTLTANPDVDFQTIMHTVDAMRSDAQGKPLFPTVNFGVAR